ncbi:hypothetical protein QTN25_005086 [Entamoeba marina]
MYEQDKCYVTLVTKKNKYKSDSCEGEFTNTEVTDFTEGENSYIRYQFTDKSDCKYSSSYQVLEMYLSDKCHPYGGSYVKYEIQGNIALTDHIQLYWETVTRVSEESSSSGRFDQSSSGKIIDTTCSKSSSINDDSNSNTESNSKYNNESESNEDTNNLDGDSLKTIILVGISIIVLII